MQNHPSSSLTRIELRPYTHQTSNHSSAHCNTHYVKVRVHYIQAKYNSVRYKPNVFFYIHLLLNESCISSALMQTGIV